MLGGRGQDEGEGAEGEQDQGGGWGRDRTSFIVGLRFFLAQVIELASRRNAHLSPV